MLIDGVVADANVLLSAVIGKAALRVFTRFDIVVHVIHSTARTITSMRHLPAVGRASDPL